MNILLFHSDELQNSNQLQLEGRRAKHLIEVLKVQPGQTIRVGLLDGALGDGTVIELQGSSVRIQVQLYATAPIAAPLQILLALPRPKVLRRTLKTLTELGVKKIVLLNAAKVEKYYWQATQLTSPYIQRSLILGLEQSIDTVLPEVQTEKLFRPFVEDRLKSWMGTSSAWVAHPTGEQKLFNGDLPLRSSCTLAIGPEGGWVDFEIELLKAQGFKVGHFGSRILTVETAIAAMIGQALGSIYGK